MKYPVTVLIADRSAAFCAQLRLALESGGSFRVVGTAGNTEEVLELVKKHCPSLVVLDLLLPGQTVLNALRVMRTMDPTPDVLVLTNTVSGYVFRCLVSLGVAYFLCKPCSVDTVVSHLEAIPLWHCPEHRKSHIVSRAEDYCVQAAAVLRELGISANLKGYHHLCRAIEMTISDPSATVGITKTLYPMIAREAHTKPDRVERNIRSAIDAARKNSTAETRLRYFGSAGMTKPSNSRIINALAQYLRMKNGDKQQNG